MGNFPFHVRSIAAGACVLAVLSLGVPAYGKRLDEEDEKTPREKLMEVHDANMRNLEDMMRDKQRSQDTTPVFHGEEEMRSYNDDISADADRSGMAQALDITFTHDLIRKGRTLSEDTIEKAQWIGSDLEIIFLTQGECKLAGMEATAIRRGNTIELSVRPVSFSVAPSTCTALYRCRFLVHGLERRDYRLAYRSGEFVTEMPMRYTP